MQTLTLTRILAIAAMLLAILTLIAASAWPLLTLAVIALAVAQLVR